MTYTIALTGESAAQINKHLEADFPHEGCGFFFGTEEGNDRKVTVIRPVDNAKEGDQRRRFEVSPLDYIKAERFALQHDLAFLGIYHSHPNHPAIPSIHDLKQAVPYFSYIIVSIQEGKSANTTSWRLDEEKGEFEEEKVIL